MWYLQLGVQFACIVAAAMWGLAKSFNGGALRRCDANEAGKSAATAIMFIIAAIAMAFIAGRWSMGHG